MTISAEEVSSLYVYVYIYIGACKSIYICVYVCMYVYTFAYLFMCIYILVKQSWLFVQLKTVVRCDTTG